jgi:hypothetical protein
MSKSENVYLDDYKAIVNTTGDTAKMDWVQQGDFFTLLSIYDEISYPVPSLNGTTLICPPTNTEENA